MLKKLLDKTVSVVLIILLNYLAFFAFDLKPAFAYFNDEEILTDNTMSVGTLDLSINSTADFSPQVTPSQTATRAIDIQNNGSLFLQASVTNTNISGDSDLCANLNLEVLAGAITLYNGSLIGLSSAPILIPTSTIRTLNFTATLTNNDLGLQNKICIFDLITNGWQDNVPNYGAGGFNDQEILPSAIPSGTWLVAPPPPPPPSPPSTPQSGDVVINELMWMGSNSSSGLNDNDEWIELRNMTNYDINISDWQFTKLTTAENLMITIPNGKIISANGFFLISNYPETSSNINATPNLVTSSLILRNSDLQIKLYQGDWNNATNIIDTADDGNGVPLRGSNGTIKKSMERNDLPNDGTLAANWHTCEPPPGMTPADFTLMKSYWKTIAQDYNCGTPGATNLSTNDPSSTPTATPSVNDAATINENIIPDENIDAQEPPTENSQEQNQTTKNALPDDTTVSEPENNPPDQPTESQQAIEPVPIKIEPTDNQNNNSDPENNN